MKLLTLILTATLLACRTTTQPDELFTPLKPIPAQYVDWYDDVLRCAITKGRVPKVFDIHRIDFYTVPMDSLTINGVKAAGASVGRDIYLPILNVDSAWIVKHEMLHVALHDYRWKPHASIFFQCQLMPGQRHE